MNDVFDMPEMKIRCKNVIMDLTHCFGLCFTKEVEGDIGNHFIRMKWASFLARNKRQKKRGLWFFDKWLVDKVRHCVKILGFTLSYDLEVLMPKHKFPLLVRILNVEPSFYIMIAPRGLA